MSEIEIFRQLIDPSVILLDQPTCVYSALNMNRAAGWSILLGTTFAVMFYLSLNASDEIFQTRLLPWIPSLIHAQEPGLDVIARFFQCQKEGFDTGCEEYKTIPTLLASNAVAYTVIFFPVVFLWQKKLSKKRPTGQGADVEEVVESVNYKQRVLPQKIRWLAIATGLATGSALLSLYWPLSVLSILLIFAGITQHRLPLLGRLVLSVVAPLVSVWVIPFGCMVFWETLRGNPGRHDLLFLAITLSWMLSPILLLWCDTAILVEARRERRKRRDLAEQLRSAI